MSASIDDLFNTLMDAGLSEDEIEKEIEKKAEDFQGFISKKGILFLIAKERGLSVQSDEIEPELYKEFEEEIDYNDFTIKISEVQEGMSNIVLLGRIQKILGIKTFSRKDGTPGAVGSFLFNDGSASIKVVLWDNHAKIMESEYFKPHEIARIIGAYSKLGIKNQIDVHLGKNGKILLAPKDVNPKNVAMLSENTFEDKLLNSKTSFESIKDLYQKAGFIKRIKGIITNIEEFKEIDLKNGEKSFLLKLIISDDTSSIRLVLWDMKAIECLKIVNIGDSVILSNVLIKYNSYTEMNEINFTKLSYLQKIQNIN